MFILSDPLKKIIKLLKLDKPLVVFEIETTGLAVSEDKIIELAYIKIWPDGRIKKEEMILNPEMPISPESSTVHGLSDQDVEDKPTFREVSQELWEIFNNCYYSGFNIINFDLLILRREFMRIGMDFDYKEAQVVDSKIIYQYMVPRTLSAAYEYYCRKEIKEDHTALGGVEAAAKILLKQLEKYQEARDWKFINKTHHTVIYNGETYIDNERKFYWRRGKAYFAFSKYKGKPLDEIAKTDKVFLQWILSSDFSEETKSIVKKAIEKK